MRTATRRAIPGIFGKGKSVSATIGWWDFGDRSCIAAWSPMEAEDATSARIDLQGNGNTLTGGSDGQFVLGTGFSGSPLTKISQPVKTNLAHTLFVGVYIMNSYDDWVFGSADGSRHRYVGSGGTFARTYWGLGSEQKFTTPRLSSSQHASFCVVDRTVYKNAVWQSQSTAAGGVGDSAYSVAFSGTNSSNPGDTSNMQFKFAAIYDRHLSTEEITALHNLYVAHR